MARYVERHKLLTPRAAPERFKILAGSASFSVTAPFSIQTFIVLMG